MRPVDCPRCEELAQEIAYLRGELGLRLETTEISRFASAFSLTPKSARLLIVLYRAGGRVVPYCQMTDAIGSESDNEKNLLGQYTHKIRAALGDGLITEWGSGLRLSPEAIARIDQILSTQEGGG